MKVFCKDIPAPAMRHHSNVYVRLMTEYVERAHDAMLKGNIQETTTCLRIAHDFEQSIFVNDDGSIVDKT